MRADASDATEEDTKKEIALAADLTRGPQGLILVHRLIRVGVIREIAEAEDVTDAAEIGEVETDVIRVIQDPEADQREEANQEAEALEAPVVADHPLGTRKEDLLQALQEDQDHQHQEIEVIAETREAQPGIREVQAEVTLKLKSMEATPRLMRVQQSIKWKMLNRMAPLSDRKLEL